MKRNNISKHETRLYDASPSLSDTYRVKAQQQRRGEMKMKRQHIFKVKVSTKALYAYGKRPFMDNISLDRTGDHRLVYDAFVCCWLAATSSSSRFQCASFFPVNDYHIAHDGVVVSLPLLSWSLSRSWNVSRTSWASHIYIVKWNETWLWDAAAAAALLDMLLPQETTRHIRWCICSFRFYFHSGGLTGGCVSFGRSSPKWPEGRDERGENIMSNCLGDERNSCFSSLLAAATCSRRATGSPSVMMKKLINCFINGKIGNINLA